MVSISIHLAIAIALSCAIQSALAHICKARVETEYGWVCGLCSPDGGHASYLAVPYAKQPLGELRFQELQPPGKWKGCRDATQLGPICPQEDLFYRGLMRKAVMSEECIHANVYVPITGFKKNQSLLPVLVYIHGGAFAFGSGDPDVHGPQYLVRDNVIVITFNYRLGPFGFLSLNSTSIPGNAGLRDMVTLLRWVRRNVEGFGGNPDDVTVAGQSSGAICAHLLSLSNAAEGLFKRAITMSGSGIRGFFTASPTYAHTMAQLFLQALGINTTDPEEAHRQLIVTPLDRIVAANSYLQNVTGLTVFNPVVESPKSGVEIILDADPETLESQGRGKNITFIIGFTDVECETFRPRFTEIDMMGRVEQNPSLLLPPALTYVTPAEEVGNKAAQITQRYFEHGQNLDQFLKMCSDIYFKGPALKMAEMKSANKGAPVYLYEFAYEADYSVFKEVLGLNYYGSAHSEDLTYVLRPNDALGEISLSLRDSKMVNFMTTIVSNFMRNSHPTNGYPLWRPVVNQRLRYLTIDSPQPREHDISGQLRDTYNFFNDLYS